MADSRVALVTGAGSGIGRAVAARLHGMGMALALLGRDAEKLETAAADLRGGPEVMTLPVDVRDEAAVTAAVESVHERFGRIDVLVNSAGVSQRRNVDFPDMDHTEFRRILDTNTDGLLLMTREVLRHMRGRDSGYIINILSTAAWQAGQGVGMYAASKMAARALTEALTEECRGTGIRVSSISPGPVASEIWSHKSEPVPQSRLKKMLRTEDIADAAQFLLHTHKNVFIPDITITPWRPVK